ncbi:IS110 family transposase [Aquisphaera insulae]|uniref:IS110 family transposase n=1 Tax=Aquisphaera insulae TaxID=2712864 RepID=UPI0013EC5044|nr:IS110 family transposase [Aquisphaera insulae]
MNYVGVDLHKKLITACVMDANRKIVREAKLYPSEPHRIVEFFEAVGEYKVVLEATASYYWFVELLEPTAAEVVLANPAKMRVIAESTKKTDKLDARVLAEFLARDMVPRAHMPTPRQRQHRALVRHRKYLRERATSVKCKIRHVLADSNADRRDLFSAEAGKAYLKGLKLNEVDRFRLADLWKEWETIEARLKKTAAKIKAFAKKAPRAEAEARELIKTAPGVGVVTAEAVLCELGDVRRFRNAKAVCAYAGLVPVVRQTGGKKARDGRITKQGSGLLRWALVEAAWRLVASVPRWRSTYDRIKKRNGVKRAIVAVARKFLCVLYAMLRDSKPYRPLAA